MPAVGQYNAFSKLYHTFDKAWAKQDLVGEQVYGKGLIFYAYDTFTPDLKIKRFATSAGIKWDEFLAQEVDDEIDYMFFYLDPKYEWDGSYAGDSRVITNRSTRATTQLVAPTAQEISDAFNSVFEIGDRITVSVEYGGGTKRYTDQHSLEWEINEVGVISSKPLTTTEIREELESNPWYYLANSRHVPYVKNSNQFQLYDGGNIGVPEKNNSLASSRLLGTTITSVTVEGYELPPGGAEEPFYNLGAFAKMSNGVVFSAVDQPIEEQTGTYSTTHIDGEIAKYRYSQKYKFNGCDPESDLVQSIVAWYEAKSVLKMNKRPVYTDVGTYREDITYGTRDTIYKKTLDQLLLYQDPVTGKAWTGITNSLFLDNLLRVEPASLMRRQHFAEMIATCIDIDYRVEKASWFERVFAVVIVILAVVAAFFTAGGSLVALAAMEAAVLASALGAATLVLGVGMYVLNMVGGLSAQGLVKIIGNIAQWVGYLATAVGIYAFIQKAGQIAAQKIIEDAGIDVTTEAGTLAVKEQMLKQTFLDNVGSAVTQSLESITTKLTEFVTFESISLDSVSSALSTINDGLEMYVDQEKKELDKAQEELTALEDDYNKEVLSNQLKHPAAVYLLVEDRLTSYDALSEMSRMSQQMTGGDANYTTWYSNVNSV